MRERFVRLARSHRVGEGEGEPGQHDEQGEAEDVGDPERGDAAEDGARGDVGDAAAQHEYVEPDRGVMRLISVTTTTMMPNHTVSYPRLMTSGKKIGTVRSSIESDSNTQPSAR